MFLGCPMSRTVSDKLSIECSRAELFVTTWHILIHIWWLLPGTENMKFVCTNVRTWTHCHNLSASSRLTQAWSSLPRSWWWSGPCCAPLNSRRMLTSWLCSTGELIIMTTSPTFFRASWKQGRYSHVSPNTSFWSTYQVSVFCLYIFISLTWQLTCL